MTHDDPVSAAMFWVGALFVVTPMVFAGIVIGVWWFQKKKAAAAEPRPQA